MDFVIARLLIGYDPIRLTNIDGGNDVGLIIRSYSAWERQMVFDSFKRMLGIRSKAATRNSEERNRVRDIRSSVSILQDKIEQLNNFENACDEAGLKDDLENAALSAHAFATACLAFINARGESDQATKGIRSQYKEVTSNLMMLAISTNSAGINLQTEARDISNTINNLMEKLELPRE